MKLEELAAKEKIEKLEYPSYELFLDINSLVKTLIKESGKVAELDDWEKEDLFLAAKYIDREKYDTYKFQAAITLGTALISLKNLYENNKIKLDKKIIIKEEKIKEILPEIYYEEVTEVNPGQLSLEDTISMAAEAIVRGIETELSDIPDYKKKYPSAHFIELIKSKLKNIESYAKIGSKIGDLLIKINKPEGFVLKGIIEQKLSNRKELLKKIKDENIYEITYDIVSAHASIEGLQFNQNHWPFHGKTGEQINFAMTLAKKIKELHHMIHESRMSDGQPFMGSKENHVYVQKEAKAIKEDEKKHGLAYLIGELINSEGIIKSLLFTYNIKAPFSELDEQLNALGIDWKLSKDLTEYLSVNIFYSGLTGKTEKSSKKNKNCMKSPQHYKELVKKRRNEHVITDDKYATAVKLLVENVINKKIKDFSLKYYAKEDSHFSKGISGWINVSEVKKNGKIKNVHEAHPDKDLDKLLTDIEKQFPKEKYEIHVKENTGVCFIFDTDIGWYPKTDFKSTIEVQDKFQDIESIDQLAALFFKTEVMAHETIHVSQIDSPLKWRSITAHMAKIYADIVIQENKKGTLDYQMSSSEINLKGNQNKRTGTLRSELLKDLKTEAALCLGTNKFSKKCRKEGLLNALCRIKKFEPIEEGQLNREPLLKSKIEDSKAAKLIQDTIEAIEKNDIKKLYRLRAKADEYHEELSTITETMAEAFGLYCTKDLIDNYPRRLSKKKRKYYAESLKSGLIRQGTIGDIFLDIHQKYRDDPELKELELNQKGLTYKRVLHKEKEQKPVKERLRRLGYNPLDIFEAYDNISELEKRVKERKKESEKKFKETIKKLGYNKSTITKLFAKPTIIPYEIEEYNEKSGDNIKTEEFINWVQDSDLKLKDVIFPINSAQATIYKRYRKHIPTFLKVIEKYGPEEAHDIMLNAQSIKELEKLAK